MVLVGVSLLDTKWCGVASWHVSVNFTKAITKPHVLTKSLYIKTWFVCLNKFECLKTVETFQAPKHDSWCLPQICWQLWFWMPFRTLLSPSSLRDKNKLNFSDQCQTKFLLPKSQNEFYDLLTIPSCTSSTTTKAKGMENMLIFHVTLRIQILTVFSVQSKYSKKTKSISLLGFVISNKTCGTWNVQIQCQPSRLSSPSRWKQIHSFQCRKDQMDSSHHRCRTSPHRCHIFTPPFEMNSIPCIAVTHPDFSTYRPSSTGQYIRMPSFG